MTQVLRGSAVGARSPRTVSWSLGLRQGACVGIRPRGSYVDVPSESRVRFLAKRGSSTGWAPRGGGHWAWCPGRGLGQVWGSPLWAVIHPQYWARPLLLCAGHGDEPGTRVGAAGIEDLFTGLETLGGGVPPPTFSAANRCGRSPLWPSTQARPRCLSMLAPSGGGAGEEKGSEENQSFVSRAPVALHTPSP